MNFLNFIENLRKKPYYVRVQILIIGVIICMIPVVLIWFHSFKNNIYKENGKEVVLEKRDINQKEEKIASLWEIFKKSISVLFEKNIEIKKENIQEHKNAPKNINPETFPTFPIQEH